MKPFLDRIHTSRKYRSICHETVRDVVDRELAASGGKVRRRLANAKTRLHKVAAFYLGEPDYDRAKLELIEAFQTLDDRTIEDVCRRIMQSHVSSRERFGELSRIYRTLWDTCGEPESLLDLACSYNPLAFRWMGLPRTVRYYTYDINQRAIELLATYFEAEGLSPLPELCDVLCRPPQVEVDVGLLLKMYHCMEHRRRGAGWELVEAVRARRLAISFPLWSLAGRQVDIIGNYEPIIRSKSAERGWTCHRLDFSNEAFLIVDKENQAMSDVSGRVERYKMSRKTV